jgi:hypothetical protein
MQSKKCDSCATDSSVKLLYEIPGKFLDFDADPERGGDGIPLCSNCLGTGRVINNSQFIDMQKEVSLIRSATFRQYVNEEKFPIEQWQEEFRINRAPKVKENNLRLVEIAKAALLLVAEPVKGCFALELAKK